MTGGGGGTVVGGKVVGGAVVVGAVVVVVVDSVVVVTIVVGVEPLLDAEDVDWPRPATYATATSSVTKSAPATARTARRRGEVEAGVG